MREKRARKEERERGVGRGRADVGELERRRGMDGAIR